MNRTPTPGEGGFRVAITGVGLVSALGDHLEDLWQSLESGISAVDVLTRFDPSRLPCRLAAEVRGDAYEIRDGDYAHEIRRAGRFVQYAVRAAEDALAHSALELGEDLASALYLGVSLGGLDKMEAGVIRQETRGPRKVSPYLIASMLPNMAASLIALRNHLPWPQITLAGACASGAQALGEAFHGIRTGRYQRALAGGCEAVLTPIAFASFHAMRMLSTATDPAATPRPFDTESSGTVVGEGAAIFVLEEMSGAERRGAAIHGEIRGYGASSGAASIALTATADCLRAMRSTLANAGLEPSAIDCIYAQAAGVKQGDESELEAIQTLFGEAGARPAITSIKGHLGHTFAASGPLNVAAALGALAGRPIPATLHLESIDPRFADLDLLAPSPRPVHHCLINSFGLGGVNAGLVLSNPNVVH